MTTQNATYQYNQGTNGDLFFSMEPCYGKRAKTKKKYEERDHLGSVRVVVSDQKNADGTAKILNYNNYYAFGMKRPGVGQSFNLMTGLDNGTGYQYGYNEMEQDFSFHNADGESYDFGARMYDSRLGRFMSTDPREREYQNLSPYLFAGNNPIRYIDVDGEGPGDVFKSIDEAAIDFAKTYNDNSIANDKEYGTTIYKVTSGNDTYFTYVQPAVGDAHSVTPSTRGLSGISGSGYERVAAAHTHGAYQEGWGGERFSPADLEYSEKYEQDLYVATPSGKLKKYDPLDVFVSEVATDIPSDPNVPRGTRANTIDGAKLPKDEPTYGAWEFIKHNILKPLVTGGEAVENKVWTEDKK
ncbi:MAG: DUF4329 domain-containing protein [Flavobacteriales bacterium]|nr:DUF4329 domain-containing protein [Flavobacteriales bacterium]